MNVYFELVQHRLTLANTNQSTLQEQQRFLELWNCVCGTCLVCVACLEVMYKLAELEEE